MIKAILFDLDGTLLPLDLEIFLKNYFESLASFFKNEIEPNLLIKELMNSTHKMINNDGTLTNEEVFMNNFLPAINKSKEKMYPLFQKFYEEEFPKLKKFAGYTIIANQIVGQAFGKGYKIVLATNPLFPRIAIEHRMAWANIDKLSWDLVTTYENSSYCKPNLKYFKQICQNIKVSPEECLMVGNDVQEDMVASKIGMKTYLVTDCLIDRGIPQYNYNYSGTLEELYNFIKKI